VRVERRVVVGVGVCVWLIDGVFFGVGWNGADVDVRAVMMQERKRQIVASAFGETGGGEKGSRLTTEDLRYLFRM